MYTTFVECPNCGKHYNAPNPQRAIGPDNVCHRCGYRPRMFEEWDVITAKWIDTAMWYKPWTWCTGQWRETERIPPTLQYRPTNYDEMKAKRLEGKKQ